MTGKQASNAGEQVTRNLNITVNDLDKVSALMQALVENKVSTIDGLNAGFQNRRELVKQALGLATDDAKDKAAFLAEQLDRGLGDTLEITEQNSAPMLRRQNIEMRSKSMMADSAPPAEMFGTQTINASVIVRFKLD